MGVPTNIMARTDADAARLITSDIDERDRPFLTGERTVIVSAHGNSLRALVKHLSGISDDEITGLEIPTGQPIIYEFDGTQVTGERYYLKDS